ncbi:MmcQ/YjbR family DNA-binding protein [Paenibacillus albiflavus]|uniref:MmcQ/YjbR family DNA-binding protein n=1 Tax=Paenibacillus albiflavus TaxID=2545760 RepID=A0A4V2WPM4_9BACL|nr:MmcQ/YjbR family DNA-binding protein [Paenibacillus albiflavus]TCZ79902.1 MmcQ/YjbR family DNA-binding protein [Paenibacillus albiflavus]
MTQQWIDYCLTKRGTSLTTPFGPEVIVMKVGTKMYALFPSDGTPTVSLKCDPLRADLLREQYPEITPGYHLNKQHWNTVALDGNLAKADIQGLIDHSYELVVKKMTKAERESLMLA